MSNPFFRSISFRRVGLGVLLLSAAVALVSSTRVCRWDGGFAQVEFQIRFVDAANRGIRGVRLQVANGDGATAFAYPVTDFLENNVPTSDRDGLMVFHHISLSPEFGGSCWYLFFVIPLGTCDSPKFKLLFELNGIEIARFNDYGELQGTRTDLDGLPKVKKQWKLAGRSPDSLPEHLRVENRNVPENLEFIVIQRTVVIDAKHEQSFSR